MTADSDDTTVDYHFRVRVKQGTTIDLLCQGAGMNEIRELTTNTGSAIETATIPGTCPVGTYTIEVELGTGDDTDLSDPIATGTGFLVIGNPPGSGDGSDDGTQDGQPPGGTQDGETSDSNNGDGNAGVSNCGNAARGSTGTPDRPSPPTLVITQNNTMVGIQWTPPNDNGSAILGYSILVVPVGGVMTVLNAGGNSEIISGLSNGTTYEIRVSACNSVGFSNWSQGKELVTAGSSDPGGSNTIGGTNNAWCGVAQAGSTGTPGTPDAPTLSGETDTTITVTWTAPSSDGGSEIKMYAVQWTPAGGSAEMVKVMSGLTHTLTSLLSGNEYQIQVAACNAVGMSLWSSSTSTETTGSRQRSPVPGEANVEDNNNGNDGDNNDGNNNGNNGNNNGNSGNNNGGTDTSGGSAEDPNDFRPVIIGRCSTDGGGKGTLTRTTPPFGAAPSVA